MRKNKTFPLTHTRSTFADSQCGRTVCILVLVGNTTQVFWDRVYCKYHFDETTRAHGNFVTMSAVPRWNKTMLIDRDCECQSMLRFEFPASPTPRDLPQRNTQYNPFTYKLAAWQFGFLTSWTFVTKLELQTTQLKCNILCATGLLQQQMWTFE